MAARDEIVSFLDSELHRDRYDDSSLNGLQVEGKDSVRVICSAVDCGLSIVERACSSRADMLLVHHGLFWGQVQAITGNFKSLLQLALSHGLNIYTSHLPLDAHAVYGNNFGLVRQIGLSPERAGLKWGDKPIGCIATNSSNLTVEDLRKRLGALTGARDVLVLPFGPQVPQKVGVVTGSGCDALWRHVEEGFDTLITGEPRQSIYHYAKENRLNVLCAGHYATETIGVRLLGEELQRRFGVEHIFIDEPTGI